LVRSADCPGNEAYFYQAGDKAKVDAAFVSAAHVVEQRIVINRVTANPIEPRGVTGVYEVGTGRYTLHCGFQRPWLFRNGIAETTLRFWKTSFASSPATSAALTACAARSIRRSS
jgi:carbon-monoxide dehydrogenase large subunit